MRWISMLSVALVCIAVIGCAQNTETPQKTSQAVVVPAANDQNQATAGGHTISINVGNMRGMKSTATQPATQPAASVMSTVNVYTGNVTPTMSGSAASTGSGTHTPTQTVTNTPTQDVRPELTFSVPIAFGMPGSILDQQATSTGRGSTSGTSKTSSNDLKWSQLIATARGAGLEDGLMQLAEQWINAQFQAAFAPKQPASGAAK